MKHNQKGSTLLLTVITIALLTVLATATLSMTTMNVGMKYTDKTVKKTHYHAESGIEQAYAIVGDKLQEVMLDARLETDKYIEKVQGDIDQAIEIIQRLYLNIDGTIDENRIQTAEVGVEGITDADIGNYTTIVTDSIGTYKNKLAYIYDIYLNRDLSAKGEVIQKLIDEKYQSLFLVKWNSSIAESGLGSLKQQLEDKNNYIFNTSQTDMKIEIAGFNEMELINGETVPDEDEKINTKITPTVIKVTSHYIDAGTQRTISADIIIHAPNVNHPIDIQDSVVIENPIWKYALVAGEDIKVKDTAHSNSAGRNLEVDGNVYAYGTVPTNSLDLRAFGGVELGDYANAKITGDVVTQSFVQTKGSSAELVIERGNVFCNSLIVQKEAVDKTGSDSTITLSDSYLYTQDDIELNGKGGKIDITGKYIGFSDGSETQGTEKGHDKSSCIIINAPDFGTGSTLRITAKELEENQGGFVPVKQGGNTDLQDKGILIPGTAWIGNNSYQTGESVSVKGNYFAYTWRFEDKDVDGNESIYDKKHVYSNNDINGMSLISGYRDEAGNEKEYTVAEKDSYFNKAYNNVYTMNPELYPDFNPGYRLEKDEDTGIDKLIEKGLIIDANDYWYSLGSQMNRTGSWSYINKGIGDINAARNIIASIRKDYEYILHHLLYRTETSQIHEDSTCKHVIDHYIHFTQETLNQNIPYELDGKKGVLYYNPSGNQVTIRNGKLEGRDIEEGIIISKGDVVIEGDLTFEGAIVTEKNITIRNNKASEKVAIKNSREIQKRLGKIVNDNILFQKPFKNSVTYQKTTQIIPGLGDTGIYKYNDLMKVTNWKQE